jgi:hypothetical protein
MRHKEARGRKVKIGRSDMEKEKLGKAYRRYVSYLSAVGRIGLMIIGGLALIRRSCQL